jgi:hypothetical protein
MTDGPDHNRPVVLTCPTCGGAVEQATEGGLPCFTCHLGRRFAAAEMEEVQARQTERLHKTALRMFKEWAELARRGRFPWWHTEQRGPLLLDASCRADFPSSLMPLRGVGRVDTGPAGRTQNGAADLTAA